MGYYIYILRQLLKREVFDIPGRVIAVLFVLFLLLVPVIAQGSYFIRILTLSAIFAIYAASWDVLAGFTGQIYLGQALFFGISAYARAKINLVFGLQAWATILLGAICAVIVGLAAGIPALRLRGFYLALVTMALPIIFTGIIFIIPDFTGGEFGLYGLDRLSGSKISDYYIILLAMLFCLFAMYKFTDAESKLFRSGLILQAIREDEITARASGINTTKYKLMAFAVSGFFSGISGGLYCHVMKIVGPSTLELFISFQAILWVIFGGMRTIYGPVFGVFILYPLVEFIQFIPKGEEVRFIIFSLILIFTLLYMPEGVTTWIRDKIEINCPRCKIVNIITRRTCRACRAPLHLEKGQTTEG